MSKFRLKKNLENKTAVTAEDVQKTTDSAYEAERNLRNFQMFALRVIAVVFVVWVLFFVIIGLVSMPSNDMNPQIHVGDMLLYYRLDKDYKFHDVVVFEKDKTVYVSRIIAAEGDTVEITENNKVIVNGNTLSETDIYSRTEPYDGYVEFPITLGPGEYFVLGDNRNGAEDSRYYGPVNAKDIIGVVITCMRRNNL